MTCRLPVVPAPGTRAGFPLIEYLSIAGLLVSRGSPRCGPTVTHGLPAVPLIRTLDEESEVQGTVWTGIKASTVGILFSMIVMFSKVAQLLIYFLRI